MKKYYHPQLRINIFEKESIVTLSGEDYEDYEQWTEAKSPDTIELEFSKFVDMSK